MAQFKSFFKILVCIIPFHLDRKYLDRNLINIDFYLYLILIIFLLILLILSCDVVLLYGGMEGSIYQIFLGHRIHQPIVPPNITNINFILFILYNLYILHNLYIFYSCFLLLAFIGKDQIDHRLNMLMIYSLPLLKREKMKILSLLGNSSLSNHKLEWNNRKINQKLTRGRLYIWADPVKMNLVSILLFSGISYVFIKLMTVKSIQESSLQGSRLPLSCCLPLAMATNFDLKRDEEILYLQS